MVPFILFSALLLTSTTELSGRVLDEQGNPVPGALVAVSTAKPRTGPAVTCPSCYAECAKRAKTDLQGRFRFSGLSPELLFSLAAGAKGFKGTISKHFDPQESSEIELTLSRFASASEIKVITGSVLNSEGKPISGAEIQTRNITHFDGKMKGSDESVSPVALTNEAGEFEITAGQQIQSIELRVNASGYATSDVKWQRSESSKITVELGPGASLRGKAIYEGKPVAGVNLEIVQVNRSLGNIVTPFAVATDKNGEFNFDHLPPKLDYVIYTMNGQHAPGVLPISLVTAPAHGERAVLGELTLLPPHRVKIKIETEDGTNLPDKSSLYVGRIEAWHGFTKVLASEPSMEIEIDDLSTDQYRLNLRTPGYSVVQTVPAMNFDINRSYEFHPWQTTEVRFVVRKSPLPSK